MQGTKGSRQLEASARDLEYSTEARQVKCDRGQPDCGWCVRNGQSCEYKERKKPGLRAGYGRELESRLGVLPLHRPFRLYNCSHGTDKLEGVLETQQHVLQQLASHLPSNHANAGAVASPVGHQQHVPQAEAALYMHTPNVYAASTPGIQRFGSLPSQTSSELNVHAQQQQPHTASSRQNGSRPSLQVCKTSASSCGAAIAIFWRLLFES